MDRLGRVDIGVLVAVGGVVVDVVGVGRGMVVVAVVVISLVVVVMAISLVVVTGSVVTRMVTLGLVAGLMAGTGLLAAVVGAARAVAEAALMGADDRRSGEVRIRETRVRNPAGSGRGGDCRAARARVSMFGWANMCGVR